MKREELRKERFDMIKTDLFLPYGYGTDEVKEAIASALPVRRDEIGEIRLLKRELRVVDGARPVYKATVAFSSSIEKEEGLLKLRNKVHRHECEELTLPHVSMPFRPVVVGAGPAGLFAALVLAESGARPIVLERGLPVEERGRSIERFEKLGILDPESNVQFGEGGAGTYSDGKLKVGSRDKYKMKVLTEFVLGGADESALYSVGAHLGTDKLPGIVRYIREKIISLGAEFIFSARLTDLVIKDSRLKGVVYEKDGKREELDTGAVILATGHSARDTLMMLKSKGLRMTPKGFGIGLRIEHPREYINGIVYKDASDVIKETASYHLVTHLSGGRSVYSFCMCPGGTVVGAASESGGIVTNGMSEYARMADNSNSALLVSVTPEDFGSDDPLAGVELQRKIERRAFSLTSSYRAPTSRLAELLEGGAVGSSADVVPSYLPGTEIVSPRNYLPDFIVDSIARAMPDFDAWLPGFAYGGAALTGPETRTTSPVRIERTDAKEALGFEGIYPSGEGAGYAGGIVSSAVDGIYSAEALIEKYAVKDN